MRSPVLLRYALVGLVVATGSLCADNDHSRKTFLMSRAPGVNLAMEYTTWHDHVYKGKDERCKPCYNPCARPCDRPCAPKGFGAHFQLTGFYQDSTNEREIGEYFGIGNGSNSFVVGTQADIDAGNADILNSFLIHNTAGDSTLAGNVSFNPSQQVAGLRFDYFQDFSCPIPGLFFKARMPLAWVERDMKLRVSGGANSDPAPGFSLQDFFKGNVTQTGAPFEDNGDLQNPLTKAKIDGRRHKFGVADIDLALGYKILHADTKHIFLNFGVTIPTGSKVRGEYLFEPVIGNGRHFGIGGGIDAGAQIWCNQNAALKVLFAAEYRYLFEKTEERTVGVNGLPLGFFFLAGRIGQENLPLFPAANVLTQDLKVKPGSQLDTMVALSFKSGGFVVDVGYNMFWKDSENVWLKNWEDGVFALAQPDFPTNTIFEDDAIFRTLNRSDLDVNAAATPSLFTHKIFAGLGYSTRIGCDYPLSFGIGGSYEFGTSNADLENYAVWAKIAISV